jgi:hypothetical protein
MFCVPEPIFGGNEGVGSRFHVLYSRTHFRRYRGRRVRFSCFALQDPFSAVSTASGPVFMLCTPGPIFGGTVIMFCAPGLIFRGTEGVRSSFHVLRSRTCFRRYRRRQVPFSAKRRASGPVFMFCASGLTFCGIEGIRSRFHVLLSRTHFVVGTVFMFWALGPVFGILRASGPIFMFCAPRPIFGGTEGVRSRFHVLRSRTHFLRYRGRRVSFSSFELQDPFLTVPTASGLEGVVSRFHVLRSRNAFSAVPTASCPVFIFCASGPIFGGTEGVGSRFHVLRSRTHFRWYRGRQIPFSCIALSDAFSAGPRGSGPVYMFCAPEPVFDSTNGIGSRLHVLRSRTPFR